LNVSSNLSTTGKQSKSVENPVNGFATLNFRVVCDIPRTREASLSIPIADRSLPGVTRDLASTEDLHR
jgi:hypothetical protein